MGDKDGPIVDQYNGVPIKMWVKGVPLGSKTMEQIMRTAELPFIHKHVAIMGDAHWGLGATIGSVIPTTHAIVPAAIGVDIGCGVTALWTGLTASDLPSSMALVRDAIEAAVPHGRSNNGGANDIGSWRELPSVVEDAWKYNLGIEYDKLSDFCDVKFQHHRPIHQLGTLGTGNHFIEVSLDLDDNVWIVLHSGSRGPGNAIGSRFINAAKKEMERYYINLPDKDLAYFPQGTKYFNHYLRAANWAQQYAKINRVLMLDCVIFAMEKLLNCDVRGHREIIDCHHNYVAMENHFGKNVWVTRKGACRARTGDMVVIPGSMGAETYIVKGKNNPQSFNSCSHGAGRLMSRRVASRTFTVEDHKEATRGVECRKDASMLDETPGAYKDIKDVMAAQSDLIEIVHELRAVVCVKG